MLFLKHIIVITLILCSTASFAERRITGGGGARKISGLLYGGFSFSSHKSEGGAGVDGYTGLAFGLGVDYKIMNQISLGIDMLYTQKNYQARTSSSVTQFDLSFLEFPFFIKWNPFKEFQLKVGPYLTGLMVSANRQSSGVNSPIKGDFTNDYGVSMGGWLGFWANPQLAVGIDVRYDMGLANVQNVAEPSSAIKTRAVNALVTLIFGLK